MYSALVAKAELTEYYIEHPPDCMHILSLVTHNTSIVIIIIGCQCDVMKPYDNFYVV